MTAYKVVPAIFFDAPYTVSKVETLPDFGVRGKTKKFMELVQDEVGNKALSVSVIVPTSEEFKFVFSLNSPSLWEIIGFGLSQKISDGTKGEINEDISLSVQRTLGIIQSGEWNTRGAGDDTAGLGLLLEAIVRMKNASPEEAQKIKGDLLAAQPKEIIAVKSMPEIKAIMAAISSERAIAKAEALRKAADAGKETAGGNALEALLGKAPKAPEVPEELEVLETPETPEDKERF